MERVERKSAEKIIVIIYSIYAVAFMFATTTLAWPVWITPVTLVGVLTVWLVYLKTIKDYRFRALLYSAVTLATFLLYNTQEDSFGGILITYCAAVIVLSILDIPEIVIPEYIFTVLLISYHGFFGDTIPIDTTQEKIRSAVQILSVFAVVAITHHLIKKHEAINQNMSQVIDILKGSEQKNLEFLATVSQEFQKPANAICSASETLFQEDISDTVRNGLLTIQAEGRALLSMTSDVLDYSALESGKMVLTEAPYHPALMINDIANTVIAYKREKDLEFILDIDPNIPYALSGDEQKLKQIILILVSNALKFTETGCITLAISARPEEYGVNFFVKVKDTGIGIAEEHLETLFSGFRQADEMSARQRDGIGISLIISKKLVSKMNGFINAKSELGKGSEFQFVVPQKVVEARPLVSVQNAENIHIIFYINAEKESLTEIRDNYMNSICHMMDGLEIRYHLCRNLDELKRRTEKDRYTHALISQDEYLEDQAYFDSLSHQLRVIMIQDRYQSIVPKGNIEPLYKPFYTLPFAAVLNRTAEEPKSSGQPLPQRKSFTAPESRVLAVDDNMLSLHVIEELLHTYKINVITATSGEACLEKLEKVPCDIIFMDHMMPGLDGVETAHKIRKKSDPYFQKVPIIALTANTTDGAREMFLEEGFQEFVGKPIDITHLEKVLTEFIPPEKIIWEGEPLPQETRAKSPSPAKTRHINREIGIQHMGGDPEDYEEVLQVYLSEGQETIQKLRETYHAGDWKNYTIFVHSLKSNSLGIGAEALGEMAKSLEFAAKDGNTDYIRDHHEEMLHLFEEVLAEISNAAEENRPAEGREPV